MSDATVVIIGGGIMGTSTAYHLARAGVRGIVVLEADALASGSSGKPLGGVRAQFSDPANIALGARSLAAFARFDDEFGVDIGYQKVGYLFLFRDDADVARYRSSIELQNSLGVDSRMITGQAAAERSPYVDPGAVVAAAWSAGDGFARPGVVVNAYAAAAADLGAEICTESPVVGIEQARSGGVTVHVGDGRAYKTPTVVCACGAWSSQIGAMVDVDLPIEPLRRQIAFTTPLSPRPPRVPFTIDYSTTAYFHCNDDRSGLLVGIADKQQAVGFDTSVTTDWHDTLRTALAQFAPTLTGLRFASGWAGLYEMTPDCNALIGEADTTGFRFLYAAGFSGHGFLQGPAVGEAVADLYLGNEPAVDVTAFDVGRFAGDHERTELNII
ncbi:MAG TPA: FAD-binding oxidoreductase [Mycobacterium sp.]|nr:FAD-binding oxidoreductase [Mycobacterium sp.]